MYDIYKITNNINGKIYIGCTTKGIEYRLNGHRSSYRHKHSFLYEDMRKFGFENFSISVLEHGDDDSIRYEREKYYIEKLNAMNPDVGYNMTIGGTGTIGYKFTEEDKKKISLAGMGRKPTERMIERIRYLHLGKKLSEETKKKISESRVGKYTGEDNPFYGKHHTEETKQKAVKTKKELGILSPVRGINLKTNDVVEFESLADASRFVLTYHKGKLSTIASHIGNSIKGRYGSKSAYGYKWSYIEKLNDYPEME
jgi:group I intron endonuclease